MLAVPLIYETDREIRDCKFYIEYPSDAPKIKKSDIFVNITPSTDPEWPYYEGHVRGWMALRNTLDRHWFVADSIYYRVSGQIIIRSITSEPCDAIALGIDQRMTRADIEGATRIFKNADNTGWLFAHSNTGHHADHEITLMAGIDGIMQPFFRQYHVDVIMGANLTAKERAANQYKLLSIFYGEVVGLARTNARTKHLGERHKDPHPENGHIHSEIKVAYEATKAKWKKDRATDVALIQGAFTYIDTALAIPDPETRWDRAARLEAEAKKKAEAEASTQTPTESSGE